MIDVENKKQYSKLLSAAGSDEGMMICNFLKQRLENLDTNKINRINRPKDEVEQEFWGKSVARDYIQSILDILKIK